MSMGYDEYINVYTYDVYDIGTLCYVQMEVVVYTANNVREV